MVDPAPREVESLTRLVKALKDPRGTVYLALLERRWRPGMPGVSRKTLLTTTGLNERSLDRTLQWLRKNKLVDRLQGRQEMYYFAA